MVHITRLEGGIDLEGIPPRWPVQEEALEFALSHEAVMLDLEMGCGKTRVAIDAIMARPEVRTVLVVCPKAVMGVWPRELAKYAEDGSYRTFQRNAGETVRKTAERLWDFMYEEDTRKRVIVINYDSVWRKPLGDYLIKLADQGDLQTVILDESHRAKAAGSKVSKYLAMLGRRVPRRLCLSGTPMANSPLDVYGQYRFLDPTIFGTNHARFLQEYAVMGGPDLKFIVGFKNQKRLNEKFDSIAYHCRMSEVADRIKLPDSLPPTHRLVQLPAKDMRTMKDLSKEFIAECGSGNIVVNNVLVKLLRLQQICSGFCITQESVEDPGRLQELNTSKLDALTEILGDLNPKENVVVFCTFRHDLMSIKEAASYTCRRYFELSGSENSLDEWKNTEGAVIGVQIQAGSEGVDMTKANHAIYFSLPHSLAMYNQSKARLYRPGQHKPVSFCHIVAEGTIDEAMYRSLLRKEDVIESIKAGKFDFGYIH